MTGAATVDASVQRRCDCVRDAYVCVCTYSQFSLLHLLNIHRRIDIIRAFALMMHPNLLLRDELGAEQ